MQSQEHARTDQRSPRGMANRRSPAMASPATRKKSARRATAKSRGRHRTKARRGGRRWSKHVTETSDAMDLKGGVFKLRDPRKIAASLTRSAEQSHRRKSNPYRSALSMLTF